MGRSLRASKTGIKKAEKAFNLKGCTQDYIAGASKCTRQTVSKFFAGRPVEKFIFQAICNELNLEWGEIAELEEDEQSSRGFSMNTKQERICEPINNPSTVQILTSPVDATIQQSVNTQGQIVIRLTGNIEKLHNKPSFKAAVADLIQAALGDANVNVEKIENGSIKITLSGSPESLQRLEELIKSGKLTEIEGMPIEDVQLLTNASTQDKLKLSLVKEIRTQGARGRDLSDTDLSNVDLSNVDLSGADLTCADLRGTNLSNTNLSYADLNSADLRGAHLSNADLTGAYLHDSLIDETTIISEKWQLVWRIFNQESKNQTSKRYYPGGSVDLSDANLSRAILRDANLSDAILSDAILSRADLSLANLSRTDLSGTILSRAILRGANLSDAILSRAILSLANLRDANLSRADLNRAILRDADLNRAILSLAILSLANLSDANLSDADLNRANLSGADLNRADLNRANLSGADLNRANLNRANLIDANLIGTNLSRANLIGTNLSRANLIDANLSDANLSGADLSGANPSRAKVENARFINSRGLTPQTVADLKRRGAIFDDSPGNREFSQITPRR